MTTSAPSILPNCSQTAYYDEFTTQFHRCLSQNPMAAAMDGEAACVTSATLEALKIMTSRCEPHALAGGVDCTPKGYYDAVVEELDLEQKVLKVGFGKVENAVYKYLMPGMPSPGEASYVAAAGCAIVGTIGAIGGAAAMPAVPLLGGSLGLVVGCKSGARVGLGLYGLWKVIVNTGAAYQMTATAINVLSHHSSSCAARPLPSVSASEERIPHIYFTESALESISTIYSVSKPSLPVSVPTPPKITPKATVVHPAEAITKPVAVMPAPSKISASAPIAPPVPIAAPPLPEQELIAWIDMEAAAQKILDIAGDLTGVTPVISQAKDLKHMLVQILTNPEEAPKLIVNQLIKEPERIFQRVLASPKDFVAHSETFLIDPTLANALNVVGTVFTVISLANDILPVLTKVSRAVFKNPITVPVVLSKELVKLTSSKIIGLYRLGVGLVTRPFKTLEHLGKGILKSPKQLCRNVKNLCGIGKSKKRKKAKRKAKKLALLKVALEKKMRLAEESVKQGIIATLPICYKAARCQWMVSETKIPQEYLVAMVNDWQTATTKRLFSKDCIQFIQTIHLHLERGDFSEVARLSPTAHMAEPTQPLIITHAISTLAPSTLRMACVIASFELAMVANERSARALSLTAERFTTTTDKLVAIRGGKSPEQLAEELDEALADEKLREECLKLLQQRKKK